MNTSNNNFAAATFIAFHIGRGGRFNNAGHKTFIGENKIGNYTNDLFLNYENEYTISSEIGDRDNLRNLFDRVIDNRDGGDASFKEKFERKTGLSFGELIYTDGGGNPVGLTAAEEATGTGCINIDNDYDTTYVCLLSECDENELQMILAYSGYVDFRTVEYAKEQLGINDATTYALGSHVSDGLLCKDGAGKYIISTEFEEGERYEGDVKTFDSEEEAQAFIAEGGRDALYVVEFTL